MRFPYVVLLSACALMLALPLLAQSPNGVINGLVADPSNRVVIGADVVVINDVTAVQYTTKTNNEGIYVMPNLPPGTYRLQVSKVGFKTLIKPDIVLNVQDALSINFTRPVGAFHETVTVESGAPLVNTESSAVSTVVDQKYVANMPLNGRSLQDLILLTPGVTTNSPQSPARHGCNQRCTAGLYRVGHDARLGVRGRTGGVSCAEFDVLGRIWAKSGRAVCVFHAFGYEQMARHRLRLHSEQCFRFQRLVQ